MTTLPIRAVVLPVVLKGLSNGELPASVLESWIPPWGGPKVTLVAPALRGYKAMTNAAYAQGVVLKSVGSYRTKAQQVTLFTSRYRRVSYWTSIRWDGSYWVHVSGAVAAIPGTSNHGLGLADDSGEERDGDDGVESISQDAVDWLVANAWRFGYSAELQSEPWHWRYFAGDDIPAEVLKFERSNTEGTPMLGLSKGDKNNQVKLLQTMLKSCGFYTGAIDGDYDTATSEALLAMRKSVGSTAANGDSVSADAYEQLFRVHAMKHAEGAKGAKGDPGAPGAPGAPGRDGLGVGSRVTVTGEITGVVA